MQNPRAAVHFEQAQQPSRRYAGIVFVGIVHVALLYALVAGLAPKIVKNVQRDFAAHVIEMQVEKPKETVKPPTLEKPKLNTAVEPKFHIDTPERSPISVAPANLQPAADTQASTIGSTHSRPPYPPIARRLSHQGRVVLSLTISPEGAVVRAGIVQSSGFPELDETAQSWVVAHWRYQPAIQGGVPVMSTAIAAIKFDLKTAS